MISAINTISVATVTKKILRESSAPGYSKNVFKIEYGSNTRVYTPVFAKKNDRSKRFRRYSARITGIGKSDSERNALPRLSSLGSMITRDINITSPANARPKIASCFESTLNIVLKTKTQRFNS
jgi:hypothetical protein